MIERVFFMSNAYTGLCFGVGIHLHTMKAFSLENLNLFSYTCITPVGHQDSLLSIADGYFRTPELFNLHEYFHETISEYRFSNS